MTKIQAKILSIIHVFWTYINEYEPLTVNQSNELVNGGKIYKEYNRLIERRISCKGKKWTCERFKQLHNVAERIATGRPFTPVPGTKVDKRGIPLELLPVYPLLTSEESKYKRFGLTVTRSYQKIHLEVELDLTSIEEGPKTIISEESINKFKGFIKTDNRLIEPVFQEKPDSRKLYRCTLAKGPNGPAVGTCSKDARAIVGTPLHGGLNKLSSFTKTEWVIHSMEKGTTKLQGNFNTGRIALIGQPGGKTRTIAIGDFGSQNVLLPLHNRIMKRLRGMKTDGTYDQDIQVQRIVRESRGHKTYCFDLSSATDRFPIILQEILLEKMFGNEFAVAGKNVMIDRDFSYKGNNVRGKVGQPLGMLSSWAVFALTHHYVIKYVAYLEGYHSFEKYAVLGDDVCIGEQKVALAYKRFMEEYGITINLDKSTISEESPHIIEFAKRLFYNGEEISGLSYDILKQGTNPEGFVDLFSYMITRSGPLTGGLRTPKFINKHDKLRIQFVLNLKIFGLRALLKRGNDTYEDLVIRLQKEYLNCRITELRLKLDSCGDHLKEGAIPVGDYLSKEGIDLDHDLIKLLSPKDNHPVIAAITISENSMMEVMEKLGMLPSDEPLGEEDLATMDTVEYMPNASRSIYFGDRKLMRNTKGTNLWFKVYASMSPGEQELVSTFTYFGGKYEMREGRMSLVPHQEQILTTPVKL